MGIEISFKIKKLVDVIEQCFECKIGCSSLKYIVQQQSRSFQPYLFLSSFASDDVFRLYDAPDRYSTPSNTILKWKLYIMLVQCYYMKS